MERVVALRTFDWKGLKEGVVSLISLLGLDARQNVVRRFIHDSKTGG